LHLLSGSSIIFLSLSVDKVVAQIGFAFVSQKVIEELLIVIDETINFVN
jgi:chromosome condensin MukBEF MukE localization factor